MTHERIAHSGFTLPAIGFGTWQLWGAEGSATVARAIHNGYTLIDSAFNYENEGAIGHGVRSSGVPREQVIVTSKLPGRHHEPHRAKVAIEESVYRTGLDHIDLYLIHWPNPAQGLYVDAWRALIAAKEQGLVRAIGVSNFLPEHLERLREETGVVPEVNQIEVHPYFPQQEAIDYHAQHGIITEAWSPLGRGNEMLSDPVIRRIADAHGVGLGQVVLAWAVARGVIPIPKAASQARQLENLAAVSLVLDPAEIAAITALGRPDGRMAGQDPATYEEF